MNNHVLPKAIIQEFETNYSKKVMQLHELKQHHVFLLETQTEKFVIKLFDDQVILRWQERFLDQMVDKKTKGLIPFTKNNEQSSINYLKDSSLVFGVMPYIPGVQIDRFNIKQVTDCVTLLSHFHSKGNGIYGRQQIIPFRSQLFEKWRERLQLFIHSIPNLYLEEQHSSKNTDENIGGLTKQIQVYAEEAIEWAQWVLEHFPQAFILYLEEQAQWERQIAHLDVAPHNFLLIEKNYYYLIDYDLVDYSPPLYDLIQFINRLLNDYHWSFDFVDHILQAYTEECKLTPMEYKILPILLVYPNDLFREWLGIWKNHAGYHPKKMHEYIKQVEATWEKRRQFVLKCQAMIK